MKKFILTEEEHLKVLNTLAEIPLKFSAALFQFFQSLQPVVIEPHQESKPPQE